MPKSRIYEIAQELNKTNKEVIEFLKEKKVEVKSHMSTLEEKDEKMYIKTATYGESDTFELEDFWNTGCEEKGGLIRLTPHYN